MIASSRLRSVEHGPMSSHDRSVAEARLLRASLVAVWLITALVSAIEANGRSALLLEQAGIRSPALAFALLWGGVAFDACVGLALCVWPGRRSADLALAATILMTLATSVLLPRSWLDPLGSISKNLPIVAALLVLRGRPS